MTRAAILLLGVLAVALPARAQDSASGGIPQALRGAWFLGESCDQPAAMLFVTARATAQPVGERGPALQRFVAIGAAPDGWTIGTLPEAGAPRLVLRSPAPDRLETAMPGPKIRDDRLPGEGTAVQGWRRCPGLPAMAMPHAEGVAALAALEQVEAACGAGGRTPRDCLGAALHQADVTGDGTLSAAELARAARGAAWIGALQARRAVDAAFLAQATREADAAARRLLAARDYDGDGRLSLAELVQDRVGFGSATGTPAGDPRPEQPGLAPLLSGK